MQDHTIRITPNDTGSPTGKLADAEIHFRAGILAGLKLQGFAVWERRNGAGRNVTFPSRQYSVNGERRSYALLRAVETVSNQDRVRDEILSAFARYEATGADTYPPPQPSVPDLETPEPAEPTAAALAELRDVAARVAARIDAAALTPAGPTPDQTRIARLGLSIAPNLADYLTGSVAPTPPVNLTPQRTTPEQAAADVAAGRPILLTSLIPQRPTVTDSMIADTDRPPTPAPEPPPARIPQATINHAAAQATQRRLADLF